MERQVKELKIEAWKMYTGAEIGEKAWRMDDEKVAYPCWEKTKALGIKNLCVHKGLPLGAFNEEACRPLDLEKAAKDWPDLNFIVYHSGFPRLWLARQRHRHQGGRSQEHRSRRKSPGSAISCESSNATRESRTSTSSSAAPSESSRRRRRSSACTCSARWCRSPGPDHILWGTDSIWNGSPQGQIELLRRLKISDDLIEKHGYAQLTPEVKNQIFGLNAARILGVDHEAARKAIKTDKLAELRRERRYDPQSRTNMQYGWVWEEDGGVPTVPVGADQASA